MKDKKPYIGLVILLIISSASCLPKSKSMCNVQGWGKKIVKKVGIHKDKGGKLPIFLPNPELNFSIFHYSKVSI